MKVLICDKTEKEYIEQMRAAGLTVDVRDDITPEELMTVLPNYEGMVVRSRTKVRQPLIDVCPNLKVILRGGAGLDTIDHEYAKSKGIAPTDESQAMEAQGLRPLLVEGAEDNIKVTTAHDLILAQFILRTTCEH